ncbi:MAG: hypothetical protein FWB71_02710 [Defluviitaleaceae bacterium]|nr:hypothetical protein [Defluviitaleaceae bacterium]
MELARKIINSNQLDGVIPLPKKYQDQNVEVVVSIIDDTPANILPKFKDMAELNAYLENTTFQKISNTWPTTNITDEEIESYRAERLAKYESLD